MFWVYWLVHFTHLALFQVFRAKQGTTVVGGEAFCEKQETNAERETRGRESKSFIFIFSLLLSRVLHLSPSSSEMYPSLRLHYNKSACHEDCMHLNKKEKRLDCSKNYGEGVSKLRNRLQESKQLSFLCPRSGVLAEIVIFSPPSFFSITNDSVADPGEGPGPPLFSDQTDAWRAERNFFETAPPTHLRVWMTTHSLIWRSGSPTVTGPLQCMSPGESHYLLITN